MNNNLKMAAYAGLISILLVPPEIILEHFLNEHPGTQWIFFLIIFIYILSVLSTVFLYYGFYLIGREFKAPAIVISTFIIILLKIFWYIFQFFAIQDPIALYNVVGGTVLVVFGIARILFGIGCYRIREALGKYATSIAILEIIIGLFLVSIILYLVGFVLSLVVAILQILLLLRLAKTFKPGLKESEIDPEPSSG